jgi:hypothetical protein
MRNRWRKLSGRNASYWILYLSARLHYLPIQLEDFKHNMALWVVESSDW